MSRRPRTTHRFRSVLAGVSTSLVAATMASVGSVALATADASSASAVAPSGAGAYVQVAPTRIVDTRSGAPIKPGASVDVQVTGALVPAGALAVAVNLTVDNATQPGYVTLYPTGGVQAGSNLNPTEAGQTLANMAIVALSPTGKVTAFVNSGGHLLMDVAGYWVAGTSSTAGRYSPVTPVRVLDTRTSAKPGRGTVVTAGVAGGASGIPAGASAVAVTITATQATAGGFITAWATGQPRPDASNVNLPGPGATVPNLAIVPVGADGSISLYTDAGTHLIVDVAGWFTGTGAPLSDEGLFVPVLPTRIADTRSGQGLKKLVGGLPAELPITIPGGVPAGASVSSVALNLTVTDAFDDGYLTASPSQIAPPDASNLNYTRGTDVAGLSITRVGANGNLNVSSYAGTHLIADIAGWFTGAPAADGGYKPTKCENLVVFTRDDGQTNSILVKDRTSAAPPKVIATGVLGFAIIAPHCEYVLIADSDNAGSYQLTRIDPLGTQSEKIITTKTASYDYVISPDGKSIYSRDTTASLVSIDAQSGAQTTFLASRVNRNYAPHDISPDGRYLDVISWPDGDGLVYPNGWYRYDFVLKTVTLVDAAPFVVATHTSPNRSYTASVIYPAEPNSISFTAVSAVNTVNPPGAVTIQSFDATWTPQGELVTTEAVPGSLPDTPDTYKVRVAPFTAAGATDLFSDGGAHLVPSFPTFALI
jgi:hypothetical protein